MSFKTTAGFNQEGTYQPDSLQAGDFPIRTRRITLAAGQNLKRGALLGVITATGLSVLSLSTASDGSEAPSAILAQDTDATAAPVEATAYIAGDFNENAMTFGAVHTAASTRDALRDLNIYLHTPVRA
jgi:hypothetical protein